MSHFSATRNGASLNFHQYRKRDLSETSTASKKRTGKRLGNNPSRPYGTPGIKSENMILSVSATRGFQSSVEVSAESLDAAVLKTIQQKNYHV